MPVHLTGSELTDIDYVFAGYSPSSHFSDDMFANKVAFITALNFPNFTLEEKNTLGREWLKDILFQEKMEEYQVLIVLTNMD